MTFDSKYIGTGLAALGVVALAAAGYLKIQTPEAAQCAVDLAAANTRLELLSEVKDQCKVALQTCISTEGK